MALRSLVPLLTLILAAALLSVGASRLARAQSCSPALDVGILAVIDKATSVEVVIVREWVNCGYTHYNIQWSGGGGSIQQEVPLGTNRATLPAKLSGTVYTVSIQGCRSRFLASSKCGEWKSRKFVTCGTRGLPCGHPRLNAPEPVRIVSGAGLCLDVHAPDQTRNGAKVQVWKCNGSPQQTWIIDEEGDAIISLAGKCLDVHAPDQETNGGRVQVWDCNGQPQQTWTARVNRSAGPQKRPIRSDPVRCLDVHAPDQFNNGARVQVWSCNATMQQDWSIERL